MYDYIESKKTNLMNVKRPRDTMYISCIYHHSTNYQYHGDTIVPIICVNIPAGHEEGLTYKRKQVTLNNGIKGWYQRMVSKTGIKDWYQRMLTNT